MVNKLLIWGWFIAGMVAIGGVIVGRWTTTDAVWVLALAAFNISVNTFFVFWVAD